MIGMGTHHKICKGGASEMRKTCNFCSEEVDEFAVEQIEMCEPCKETNTSVF